MNILDITFNIDRHTHADERGSYLSIFVNTFVDGKQLNPSNTTPVFDFIAFWLSTHFEGEHYLLNCSCGVSECTSIGTWRIDKGVLVRHTPNSICWTFAEQYHPLFVEQGFVTADSAAPVTLEFSKQQVVELISRCVDELDTAIAASDSLPYTFNEDEGDWRVQGSFSNHLATVRSRYLEYRNHQAKST